MQTSIDLPFDDSYIRLRVPTKNLVAVLTPPASTSDTVDSTGIDEMTIVRNALEHPVDSPRLSILAKGKQKIVVVTSDHTRPVPSAITLPLLLEEILAGNPDADITIIVATGLHRGMNHQEMISKFGERIVSDFKIVNHDSTNRSQLVDLGTLPSGSKCEINRLAVEADLLVAEGFIEPHFFAGFSGGRKSVLPGIASQDCVNINHSAKAIQDPRSITGVLDGNPINEDMMVAAGYANLAFILNVLLDEEKKITSAYAGDYRTAHRRGCEELMAHAAVDSVKADIVVTTNGGYPLDQNLYQCPKGLSSALNCAHDDTVIILAMACRDGLGGENFGRMMQEGSPSELMQRVLAIPPEKTISEQWCVQRFAEALMRYKIILVSPNLGRALVEKMSFIYADTIDEAMEKAFALKGPEAKVTVIPNGVSVIIRR